MKKPFLLFLLLGLAGCVSIGGCKRVKSFEPPLITEVPNLGVAEAINSALLPNPSPDNCDVCGKSFGDGKETSIVALRIVIEISKEVPGWEKWEKLAKKQLGPYPYSDYAICYECWLRSLGVRP